MAEDGHGQRGSFGRVCSRAELIEKDQGAVICLLQDADDVRHVGRKCTQALLDALLIADIREDLRQRLTAGVVPGRNVQACLAHERQQADRLQGNSLAAGVGAGHDQHPVICSDHHIYGNNFLLIQKGVTGLFQADQSIFIENGFCSAVAF